jgi:hypothetical protein
MNVYSYDKLRDNFEKELKSESMPENLYKSVDNISRIILTIISTKGNGWAEQVVDDKGQQLLSKEEQVQFTETFKPHIESIIGFMGNKMSGGAGDLGSALGSALAESLSTSGNNESKSSETSDCTPKAPEDLTLDGLFYTIVNKVNEIDKIFNNIGIIRTSEIEHDRKEDITIIPKALAVTPTTILLQQTLIIPYRTLTFMAYLALDIGRIVISSRGNIFGRKIMTVLLAIFELLRGDWKKSILTIIGYYTDNYVLLGELMKIYLSMFRKINPKLQESIIYGTYDSTKSFIVGILLSIFQVISPYHMRMAIITAFDGIKFKKDTKDGIAENIGLSARPDYLSPSWEDINNLQALMTDEAFMCSCQFMDLVKAVSESAIIKIVLEIMGIPVIEEAKRRKCPEPCHDMKEKTGCTPFITQVLKENKLDKTRKITRTAETPVTPGSTSAKPTKVAKGGRRLRHANSSKSMNKH